MVEHLPKSIVLREVALIHVKGKQEPTKVFEPMTLQKWRSGRRDSEHLPHVLLDDVEKLENAFQEIPLLPDLI